MKQNLIALISGIIFGAGLILSGMTNPSKVIGFLDITGAWDPSLAFVMGGALLVMFVTYRLVNRLGTPIAGGSFQIPQRKDLDARLITGSALFGIGWGLSGYCPGPAITTLGFAPFSGNAPDILIFVAGLLIGMFAFKQVDRLLAAPAA